VATVYRVSKWREIYETADSRKHKTLSWVSIPIDRQSSGYQSLIERFGDDAPAIYGAWCALVSVAGQCPERGLLANSRCEGHSVERIARLAFMPVEPFRKVVEWASSEDVKWLEVVTPEQLEQERQSIDDRLPIDQQSIGGKSNSALPNLNLTLPVRSNIEGDHKRFDGDEDAAASDDPPSEIPPPDPDKALRFGNAVGKCGSRKDVELAWKLTALERVLGEAWFANITTALNTVKDPPRNRWAYARGVAAKGSKERPGPGKERLSELLKRAPNPPDDWPRTRGSP
jgi:hypothetical protein